MSDPMGFFSQDFAGIETSEGLVSELLAEQYALLKVEDATYEVSKEQQTPCVALRLRCDEKHAKTPKQSFFYRFWLTAGMQKMLDGFTKAVELGRLTKTFGEGGPGRPAVTKAEIEPTGKALAAALKGRIVIGHISTEVDKAGRYADKNRLQSWHRASHENIEAIAAGGYEAGKVTLKTRKLPGGGEEKYLAAKTGGATQAAPVGGGPQVIA